MKNSNIVVNIALSLSVALFAWILPACDDGQTCGLGTVKQSGKCVPTISGCGAGTVEQNGTCVPACPDGEYWDGAACSPVPECAAGTVFDAGSNTCVPECGDDQSWDGSACVPICAPGTQPDPDSGLCEPSPDTCAPGTTWVDGQCTADLTCGPGTHLENDVCVADSLPPADVLESDDPDLAATFGLPAQGETISLGGTVDTPVDETDNGYTNPNWDAFAFTAPAGTWLRIDAVSPGAALPAFMIMSSERDEDDNAVYIRYVLNPIGPSAGREFYLPIADTYVVLISDFHNMMIDVFGYGFIPVGGDDFTYRANVQNLGTPSPTEVASLPMANAGDLSSGALPFFDLTGLTARDLFSVTSLGLPVADQASDVFPVLMIFAPDGSYMGEILGGWSDDAQATLSLPLDGDYLLVQDWLTKTGAASQYDLSALVELVEDCSLGGCTPQALAEGEHRVWSWDLLAGDFFLFNATVPADATENLGVALYDETFTLISEASAGSSWNRWDHLVAGQDTWVYLWIDGWFGGAVPTWTFETVHQALPALTEGVAETDIPAYAMPAETITDCGLSRFSGAAGQVATFVDFATSGASWIAPGQEIHDLDLLFKGPALDTNAAELTRMLPAIAWLPEDGQYLHRAHDTDAAAAIAGGAYDVTLHLLDPADLGEPLSGAPVQANGEALHAASGLGIYTFTASSGASYSVDVTPLGGSGLKPELWLLAFGYHYNDNWYSNASRTELGMLTSVTAANAEDPISGNVDAPYAGSMVVVVRDADGLPGAAGFDIQVTQNP